MLQLDKKAMLVYNFWLRKLGKHFYLVNTHYNNIVFEPYEITQKQFNFIKKLNGRLAIKEIIDNCNNNDWIKARKFFEALDEKKAIKYVNSGIRKGFYESKARQFFYDAHFEFESKCNFRCRHCYQEKYIDTFKDMSIKEIGRVAKSLQKIGIIKIALSGGEPFMRRDLKKICEIFHKRGIKVDCIFTNGSLIKNTDIKWLSKESIHVFISLDGLEKGNATIRNLPPKIDKIIFNKIINNIKLLRKSDVIVKVNTIIHKYNIKELEGMYELFKNIGVVVWRMAISKDVGRYIENKNKFSVKKMIYQFV